jgi:hypothetical protein
MNMLMQAPTHERMVMDMAASAGGFGGQEGDADAL